MNWVDESDVSEIAMGRHAAAELNAMTVGQADKEWMHRPDTEPDVPDDIFEPLSRLVEPTYDRTAAERSKRRAHARRSLKKVQGRTGYTAST